MDDFKLVESKIRETQDSVMRDMGCDTTKSKVLDEISERPIYVQIVKERIPDVTLIDLPGINYSSKEIKGMSSLKPDVKNFSFQQGAFFAELLNTKSAGNLVRTIVVTFTPSGC